MNARKLYTNAYRLCRDEGGENLDGEINTALDIGLITELDAAKAHIIIGWAIVSHETCGTPDHYEHWMIDTRQVLLAKRIFDPLVKAFKPFVDKMTEYAEKWEHLYELP